MAGIFEHLANCAKTFGVYALECLNACFILAYIFSNTYDILCYCITVLNHTKLHVEYRKEPNTADEAQNRTFLCEPAARPGPRP